MQGLRILQSRFNMNREHAVDASKNPPAFLPMARVNFWGSQLGPTPLVPRLPPLGDTVSQNVDFSAWCLSPSCTDV